MGGADAYHKVPEGAPMSGGVPTTYVSAETIPASSYPPPVPSENHHIQGQNAESPPPELGEAACAPAVAGGHGFVRKPMQIGCCPHCNIINARTRITTHPHWKSWIAVGALAVVFWPLCWIPLVMDEVRR